MRPAPCNHPRAILADHERLLVLLSEVLVAANTGEEARLREQWAVFEGALAVHLSEEESYVLALLLRQGSPSARAIVQEHKHLRARVSEIEASLGSGGSHLDIIETFAAELRAHMQHEDGVLHGLAEAEGASSDTPTE